MPEPTSVTPTVEPDGVAPAEPTLADRDDDQDERGRIGYGPNERKSSYLLGALLIAVIAAIGIASALGGDDDNGGTADRRPAANFTIATFDGGTFNLADHRGQVVVVNFWASWCDPCRKEMPAFQEASQASGDVVFVGVGAKTDKDDEAHAFAEEFGITYPIGRDTEGGTAGYGQIATDYGIYGYPATYFIDPEGNVSATVLGELDVSQLQSYIDRAKGE
jgi:thiol-disulfide isomerase/thioredoxin